MVVAAIITPALKSLDQNLTSSSRVCGISVPVYWPSSCWNVEAALPRLLSRARDSDDPHIYRAEISSGLVGRRLPRFSSLPGPDDHYLFSGGRHRGSQSLVRP